MATKQWQKLRAGDYAYTTWHGDAQLTYRAIHQNPGWVVSRQVTGAGLLVISSPLKTLRDAQAAGENDALEPL
jgi:hypothetical protein